MVFFFYLHLRLPARLRTGEWTGVTLRRGVLRNRTGLAAGAELIRCNIITGMSARLWHLLLLSHSQQFSSSLRFIHLVYFTAERGRYRDCAGPAGAFSPTPEVNEWLFCEARRGNNISCVVCNFFVAAPAADGALFLSGTVAANGPLADQRVHGPHLMIMTCTSEPAGTSDFFFFFSSSFYHRQLWVLPLATLASITWLNLALVTGLKQQLDELDSSLLLRDVLGCPRLCSTFWS